MLKIGRPYHARYPRKRVEREVEEPAFEEFEITATTKGHTPRRR